MLAVAPVQLAFLLVSRGQAGDRWSGRPVSRQRCLLFGDYARAHCQYSTYLASATCYSASAVQVELGRRGLEKSVGTYLRIWQRNVHRPRNHSQSTLVSQSRSLSCGFDYIISRPPRQQSSKDSLTSMKKQYPPSNILTFLALHVIKLHSTMKCEQSNPLSVPMASASCPIKALLATIECELSNQSFVASSERGTCCCG